MFKKSFGLATLIIALFSTISFAYTTPYLDKTSDFYKFMYRISKIYYQTPIRYNSKGKPIYDEAIICALKGVKLSTFQSNGASYGICDLELQEIAQMIEEDLKKESREIKK